MALSVGTGVDVLVGADAVVVIGVAEEWFPNGEEHGERHQDDCDFLHIFLPCLGKQCIAPSGLMPDAHVIAFDLFPFRETPRMVDRNIYALGLPIQDQFRHA